MENLHLKKILHGCKNKTCEKHGDYKSKPYKMFTDRVFWSDCPICDEELKKEGQRKEKEVKKTERLNIIKYSGISKRFINSTFKNFNSTVSKNAKDNLKKINAYCNGFKNILTLGSCLILCGKPGTGKTHLACALGINIIDKKYRVRYTTSYKMMTRIKATYSRNSDEQEQDVINKLTTTDLLIIDEIGVQFGSEAEKILFYQIINGRYDNVLPTILISNLTQNELIKFIGERCFDRLKEGSGVVLSFNWGSYRK